MSCASVSHVTAVAPLLPVTRLLEPPPRQKLPPSLPDHKAALVVLLLLALELPLLLALLYLTLLALLRPSLNLMGRLRPPYAGRQRGHRQEREKRLHCSTSGKYGSCRSHFRTEGALVLSA